MRKLLRGTKALNQMYDAGVQILRQVTILQQQFSGVMIRQIILQRMGTVGIDQGAPPAYLKRQYADSLGNQSPV